VLFAASSAGAGLAVIPVSSWGHLPQALTPKLRHFQHHPKEQQVHWTTQIVQQVQQQQQKQQQQQQHGWWHAHVPDSTSRLAETAPTA
jgi:hypothetical protein